MLTPVKPYLCAGVTIPSVAANCLGAPRFGFGAVNVRGSMAIHFECTQCGKCCHGLRLTLSVDEAIAWAENGDTVQVLTEALPWSDGHAEADAQAEYQRDRSFPATSGEAMIRIAAILVAFHPGPCPHLRSDMRCGNYAARPRICRIYPLESRPFTSLSVERRLCPPEAWTYKHPLLMIGDVIADPEGAEILAEHRQTLFDDVRVVSASCSALGITDAAFANEGLAVHTPKPSALVAALRSAKNAPSTKPRLNNWTVVTNRKLTLAMLEVAGCTASLTFRGEDYLGSFQDEP